MDCPVPMWMEIAKKEMGQKEISGVEDNPRIVEYHKATSLKATDDETAWCSAFVNWCMKQAGIKGTDSAAARSWLKWGKKIEEPSFGCIVILKRGKDWQGHVGFYIEDDGNKIALLGGNQSNSVCIAWYPYNAILGFRWPEGTQYEQC